MPAKNLIEPQHGGRLTETSGIDRAAAAQPKGVESGHQRKRLLYVEPESDGHHLAVYASAIWQKFFEEGWIVSWLTSEHAARSPIAVDLVRRFGSKLEIHISPFLKIPSAGGKPMAWLRYQTHHRRLLNKVIPALIREPTDCIFLPWLNYCDRACGMFGLPAVDVPIAALHMHVSIHEPIGAHASWMRRASRSITKSSMGRLYTQKNLKKVAVIMETYASFARSSRMPGWEKIEYIPDAGSLGDASPRAESRAHYSLNEKDVAVLCFGALTQRKGVEILLKAADAAADSANIVVILAGKQDHEIEAMTEGFSSARRDCPMRIVIRNAFVDTNEERRLFAASDVVWVGYPGFLGSSGVLIQAGCASLPVISGLQGEIGNTVRAAQCGISCNLNDLTDVAATIRTLASDAEMRAHLGKNGYARSERHSPRIFAANVFKLIEESAGRPAGAT
jgi:glycosyltransferase involved in cell wall biosynthesis